MRPPTPTMFPKVVPPQGDEINGKFIPGGTSVGWNLLPLMYETRYWGREPKVFRPERFTEADETTRTSRERLVDMVFGYGRFACAGKPLALMELNKFYFEVSCTALNDTVLFFINLTQCGSCFDILILSWSILQSPGSLRFGLFGLNATSWFK